MRTTDHVPRDVPASRGESRNSVETMSTIDARLLAILACPEDKGPLYFLADEDALYNPRLKRRYDVREGIPVMLVNEATTVADAEHARIMARVATEGIAPTFVA